MPTALAESLRRELEKAPDSIVSRLDPLDMALPRPGQNKNLWPKADISGHLHTGEAFIVEVDDHADPVRSLVKYWPLLHAVANRVEYPPIAFIEVSKPDATFGLGYQVLARFVGQRFEAQYPRNFRFSYIDLSAKDVPAITRAILEFLGASGK